MNLPRRIVLAALTSFVFVILAFADATYTLSSPSGFVGTFTSHTGGGWSWNVTYNGQSVDSGSGDSAAANNVFTFYGFSFGGGGNQNEN